MIKSARKVLLKGAKEVLPHLDHLFTLLKKIDPKLADLGQFKNYLNQNWGGWAQQATGKFNEMVGLFKKGLSALPNIGDLKRPFEEGIRQIEQAAAKMLPEAFGKLKQRIDEVIDDLIQQIGGSPSGGAAEMVTPEGFRVKVEDPKAPLGRDPMLSTGSGLKKASPEKVVNALKDFSSKSFKIDSETFLLDKKRMKHSLERHHPLYWDGSQKANQSFFDSKMSIDDIIEAQKC